METFGQIIANERRERRLTLKNIVEQIIKADGCHISVAYLDNLEKDLRTPSPELNPQFAEVLQLPADLLYCALGLFLLTFQNLLKLVVSFFLSCRSFARRYYLTTEKSGMTANLERYEFASPSPHLLGSNSLLRNPSVRSPEEWRKSV